MTVVSFGIVKNFGLFLVSAMCKMLQVFVSIMRQSGFFLVHGGTRSKFGCYGVGHEVMGA